ncbi:hypothetical protein Trydic_g5180 [Trypoxylus dichotomus]
MCSLHLFEFANTVPNHLQITTFHIFKISQGPLMYNRKSKGPRLLPIGTPEIGTSGTVMLDVELTQRLQVYPAIAHD